MPWYKITLTDKQLLANESEALIEAFQEVYDPFKSQSANMALFRAESDNCTLYLNASAGMHCKEIREEYSAEETPPVKQLHRIAGEVGAQILNS